MKKILGLVLFGLMLVIPGAARAQSATAQWNAVPLPVAPTVTKLVPASSYVTSAGFSQNGTTFTTTTKLQILGTGFTASTTVTFNGTAVSATFVSATEVDIVLTQSMVAVPTAAMTYTVVVTNPIPVLQ